MRQKKTLIIKKIQHKVKDDTSITEIVEEKKLYEKKLG